MMFDVGVRLGYNAAGKAMNRFYRVHDTLLSKSLRKSQDAGQYIFSIIPLFRKKENESVPNEHYSHGYMRDNDFPIDPIEDPIDHRILIDPHGY
jgi:hypothetical protein